MAFDISDGFVGQGVQCGDGGWHAEVFAEDFGCGRSFFDTELAVSIGEDAVVDARADDDVLEASLVEELDECGLVENLGFQQRDRGFSFKALAKGRKFRLAGLQMYEFGV